MQSVITFTIQVHLNLKTIQGTPPLPQTESCTVNKAFFLILEENLLAV